MELKSLNVIELKIGDFKPDYAGKMQLLIEKIELTGNAGLYLC